jgi:hypothetical protein
LREVMGMYGVGAREAEVRGGVSMGRRLLVALAAVGLLVITGKEAKAMTTDGTLITNVACATYMGASGGGFSVSYCATATTRVDNPCIALQKQANPTVQSSGGTDRLPDNVAFGASIPGWNGGTGGTWTPSYGANNTTWAAGSPGGGQTSPYYLRFALNLLGPCASAMQSYSVTVL